MARLLLLTTAADSRDPGAPIRTLGDLLNELCDELDTGRRRAPGLDPADAAAIAGFLGLTPRQAAVLRGWLKSKAAPGAAPGRKPAERPAPLAVVGSER